MTKAQYAIVVTRSYYGPRTTKTRLIDDRNGGDWTGTRREAREEIEALDEGTYYLSHNEYSRPSYSIVRA